MSIIHATSVCLKNKGILILGKSGAGKSDLALRLIEEQKAMLVADDITELSVKKGEIYASCPENIRGKIEVRGVGIVQKPYEENIKISLVVELVNDFKKIERLPEPEFWEYEKIKIKQLKLYPFEISACHKVRLACDEKA